jgi:hypothetical protein
MSGRASGAPGGWRGLLDLLPPALILIAEAAWVAVLYALLQGASQEPTTLAIPSLAAFAAAGLIAARLGPRWFGRRALGDQWPIAMVGLTMAAAALGWLAAPATRDALLAADLRGALVVHPGGWLAGLAFFRGAAHARQDPVAEPTGALVGIGVPAIAIAFLLGGAIAEPGRSEFLDAALPATIVFVGSGTLALALARISRLGGASGFDWRRNPAWLGLLVVLVAGLLAIAVPASFALGPLVLLLVALLPVPLLVAGLFAGVDRTARRTLLIVILAAVGLVVLMRIGVGPLPSPAPVPGGSAAQPVTPDDTWIAVAAWTLFFIVIAGAIALLSALWMRQTLARGADDVAEDRSIDYGTAEPPSRAPRLRLLPRRTRAPTDAAGAYLAALDEIRRDDDLRRSTDETPSEHARRLRALGAGLRLGRALDFLAADYELSRFGGRTLSAGEHRRALDRWRRVQAAMRTGRRSRTG